ncbi:Homeobox protein DLX-4 [Microtus ochrogaster]|uniref:Homeobox protein DLX-4 n=1 Tax=Microtus ochrogaster TaxID=79684 RepID=A0A8J6KK78_MICOH|nr:Homeobox protein DLX-4 [Microtus ochrogaster]
MTSLPCSLPGREASNVVFPDLAPAPSVVAAYPLGLSPETAASPDLSYSQPYGHLLPYSYPEPATPGDAYLPSQQLSAGRRGLNPSTRQLSTLRSLKQVMVPSLRFPPGPATFQSSAETLGSRLLLTAQKKTSVFASIGKPVTKTQGT